MAVGANFSALICSKIGYKDRARARIRGTGVNILDRRGSMLTPISFDTNEMKTKNIIYSHKERAKQRETEREEDLRK